MEDFQALPKAGYTRMFKNMLAACGDKVKILLKCDYREILPHVRFKHMIYTGPIDAFYDYCHGHLPYRSLRFESESFQADQLSARAPISGKSGFWQPAMQVNYPNEEEFTRIVEMKHATGQLCENTTIVREYPEDFGPGREAYYPIPAADASALYQKYKLLAESGEIPPVLQKRRPKPRVSFIGRLATYRYYNMDQVVGMALKTIDELS